MKCSNCGSERHTWGKCPEEVANAYSTADDNREAYRAEILSPQVYVNPFERKMMLNQLSVIGLIDTGCSDVSIRNSFVERCHAEVRPKRTALLCHSGPIPTVKSYWLY